MFVCCSRDIEAKIISHSVRMEAKSSVESGWWRSDASSWQQEWMMAIECCWLQVGHTAIQWSDWCEKAVALNQQQPRQQPRQQPLVCCPHRRTAILTPVNDVDSQFAVFHLPHLRISASHITLAVLAGEWH